MTAKEYKERKLLKQSLKAIPKKETREPLLKSTVRFSDPFSLEGYDSMMCLMFPLLMKNAMRKRMVNR